MYSVLEILLSVGFFCGSSWKRQHFLIIWILHPRSKQLAVSCLLKWALLFLHSSIIQQWNWTKVSFSTDFICNYNTFIDIFYHHLSLPRRILTFLLCKHMESIKLVISSIFISWKNSFSNIGSKCILPNTIKADVGYLLIRENFTESLMIDYRLIICTYKLPATDLRTISF